MASLTWPQPTDDDLVAIIEAHGGPIHEDQIIEKWEIICVERALDAAVEAGDLDRVETEDGPVYQAKPPVVTVRVSESTMRLLQGGAEPEPYVQRTCVACGKPLVRKRQAHGKLEQRSHFEARKTCDRKCMGVMQTKAHDDVEPPNPSGLCMCGCGEKTPIATWTCRRERDIRVKGHPMRYIAGHSSRGKAERAEWLRKAARAKTARVAPRREQVAKLHAWEGISEADIARTLGISRSAVLNDVRWLRSHGRARYRRVPTDQRPDRTCMECLETIGSEQNMVVLANPPRRWHVMCAPEVAEDELAPRRHVAHNGHALAA